MYNVSTYTLHSCIVAQLRKALKLNTEPLIVLAEEWVQRYDFHATGKIKTPAIGSIKAEVA